MGELLTDLFLDTAPQLARVEARLRARGAAFGEGLQLVNILKDSDSDARDGRVYLGASVGSARALGMARQDLLAAGEYVEILQSAGAPRGIVAFTAFPVLLRAPRSTSWSGAARAPRRAAAWWRGFSPR